MRPLPARDPHEHHRAATPLELLYDLVLVIAVGAAAAGLHHAINENHIGDGIFVYLFMFWALWWPWVNFTWFASAYDNDDVIYRCLVFLQMVGALMTAVGIKDFTTGTYTLLPLAGYIVMRIGMVSLWLRAARSQTGRQRLRKALCDRHYRLPDHLDVAFHVHAARIFHARLACRSWRWRCWCRPVPSKATRRPGTATTSSSAMAC